MSWGFFQRKGIGFWIRNASAVTTGLAWSRYKNQMRPADEQEHDEQDELFLLLHAAV